MNVNVTPGSVEILPNWLADGESFNVEVRNLSQFADQEIEASIFVFDAVETWWHTSVRVALDGAGNGRASRTEGLAVGSHAAVYVGQVQSESKAVTLEQVLISIANSPTPGEDLDEVMAQFAEIQGSRSALYELPLGDKDAAGALYFRAISIVDALLTTTALQVPGAHIRPLAARLNSLERLALLNDRLGDLGWTSRVPSDPWADAVVRDSHLTEIVVPEIYAASMEEAMTLLSNLCSTILVALARHRGSAGQQVATLIEHPKPDGSSEYRVMTHTKGYRGNLAGGPIAGESQRAILNEYLAIERSPFIRLASTLYAEAIAERSIDSRYFRLWSILELLSGARIESGLQVRLRDGTPWPGGHGTTSHIAPRVYKLIALALDDLQMDETSLIAPFHSLYEAVRGWYGRRNATGHYGRFVPGDPAQMRQNWYAQALATKTDEWLRILTFERVVDVVISAEIRRDRG